jgi:PhzF family phenazine biosynthesis protein
MKLDIYQVDAFSDKVFVGNPAAVVPMPSWPDAELMQSIAMENNLSETAFFVKQGDDYGLRWFTPLVEMDLCGHATLASAYVILNHIEPARNEVSFHTCSGVLRVVRENERLHMDFPARPPQPCPCPAGLVQGLGRAPRATYVSGGLLALFDTEEEIRTMQPDPECLKRLDAPYVIVSAKGAKADFVLRAFGPKVGIAEDPVTGSAQCILAPYWAQVLGKNTFHVRQLSRRGGEIYCELNGDRVGIAGHAKLFMRGEIYL